MRARPGGGSRCWKRHSPFRSSGEHVAAIPTDPSDPDAPDGGGSYADRSLDSLEQPETFDSLLLVAVLCAAALVAVAVGYVAMTGNVPAGLGGPLAIESTVSSETATPMTPPAASPVS